MIATGAFNPAYVQSGTLDDDEKQRLVSAAPEGYGVEFVEWANHVLVEWQLVQDLLNPLGGDFEVVGREGYRDYRFRIKKED